MIIILFSACSLAYLYFLFIKKDDDKAILFAKIGIVLAIALASYTSFLISMGKARPLWHSAIMPPLFLFSSGISGLAIVMLIANLLGKISPKDIEIQKMGKILIILILVDIFFLNDMYVLYIGIAEAKEIALLLLAGKFAFLFLGVELLFGSIFPIFLLSKKNIAETKGGQILASIASLVGVFTMRYIIIIAGQYFPLS
jgi:molybdopterin-containing oxidoreductase family membrane subunit